MFRVRTIDPAIHDASDTLHRDGIGLGDSLALFAHLLKFVIRVEGVDGRPAGVEEGRGVSARSL
eukprot:7391463-Prymnesium_polylepis.3